MNQPAHDWALLESLVDEDAEEELLKQWWMAEDSDAHWIDSVTREEKNDGYDGLRWK